MSILVLKTALAALIATSVIADQAQEPIVRPPAIALKIPEIKRVIKNDLESIAGQGAVDVSVDNNRRIRVRIAVATFNERICDPIYERERELARLFPDLDFDFSFDGPTLAQAIKADLEAISGPGTVDVSIDSKTLFNVRIGLQNFNSELYGRLYNRELELYRLFRDLNFDFYLRLQP
jgi:copper chaperone CopZ